MSDYQASAFMEQRATPPGSLELFPTPPYATRAALYDIEPGIFRQGHVACDPCSGLFHMVRPLSEHFALVHKSDVFDYGLGAKVADFLTTTPADYPGGVDWLFLNPPFELSLEMTLHALSMARIGVAVFNRLNWIAGQERHDRLFAPKPPQYFCPFAERVALIEGCWDPEASTATGYGWYVWHKVSHYRSTWNVRPIPPGAAKRHSRIEDLQFANPGEAKRRKKARGDAADTSDQLTFLESESRVA